MKIAVIGRGRVATHLSQALMRFGHEVTGCGGRQRVQAVPGDADIIILAIKDDAISVVAEEFADRSCLVVHTSGSVAMDAIHSVHRGVLYPMQTFTVEREVDFRKVPLFLETAQEDDMPLLKNLASSISNIHMPLDSAKRRVIHLSAVMCCNFVNHLYQLSHEILAKEKIPFDVLLPLIDETAAKVHELTPYEAQTGPAIRWDEQVIARHIDMLCIPRHRDIYRILSESIKETHNDNSQ